MIKGRTHLLPQSVPPVLQWAHVDHPQAPAALNQVSDPLAVLGWEDGPSSPAWRSLSGAPEPGGHRQQITNVCWCKAQQVHFVM